MIVVVTRSVMLAIVWWQCGCSSHHVASETVSYAVGARDHYRFDSSCRVADNDGAIVVIPDVRRPTFEAVKPGKARIECGDDYGSITLVVRTPVRVALRRDDRKTTPIPMGGYTPSFCLVAFDHDGTELRLGMLVKGAEFRWSDHVRRTTGHGMFPPAEWLDHACEQDGMADKEGTARLAADWHGFSANAELEIKGRLRN
jgi:hypothetical protein